jgi:hypothetical protein
MAVAATTSDQVLLLPSSAADRSMAERIERGYLGDAGGHCRRRIPSGRARCASTGLTRRMAQSSGKDRSSPERVHLSHRLLSGPHRQFRSIVFSSDSVPSRHVI